MMAAQPGDPMDLLPGLNLFQEEFARQYYPVFEQIKTAVLLTSGAMLLLDQEQMSGREYRERIESARLELSKALRRWSSFIPHNSLRQEYTAVRAALDDLERSYRYMSTVTPLTRRELETQVAGLLDAFRRLREISLSFWRLELVGETHPHHH